jgi:hypothetical protein
MRLNIDKLWGLITGESENRWKTIQGREDSRKGAKKKIL